VQNSNNNKKNNNNNNRDTGQAKDLFDGKKKAKSTIAAARSGLFLASLDAGC